MTQVDAVEPLPLGAGGHRLAWAILAVSALLYGLHFWHLLADFPNGSPWAIDWAKMTDEGWWGGAAVHYFSYGNWYLPESYNPGVAMPVWPAMLAAWFKVTGASMAAARTLTLLLYGASLALLYGIVRRACPKQQWVASLAVLLSVANPMAYAYNRLALLEPVMVFWLMLALWLAGRTGPRAWGQQVVLGLVLALLVLTKSTGIALVPAPLYLMAAQEGWADGAWAAVRRWAVPVGVSVGTMLVLAVGYVQLVTRSRYLIDYKFVFSINNYHARLAILPNVAWMVFKFGVPMQVWLWGLALVTVLLSFVWLRTIWRLPLFVAAVLALAGQLTYIAYHVNYAPRYYLVAVMPMAIGVALGLGALMERAKLAGRVVAAGFVTAAACAMGVRTWDYVVHPEYSFLNAAQGMAAIVRADGMARPMLLSDSAEDVTLLAGLQGVTEQYHTHGLDALLGLYQPGWYAAWLGWEDGAIADIGQRYRLTEVGRYRVFDDPKRQELVLYRLTPR